MAVSARVARTTRLREWISPLLVAVGIYVLSQQWSGLDTPDSEFYASLAIFTDAVTDRAPIDSYYWTRLGLIAPAHLVISLLGIWEGFAVYKAFITLILSASLFAIFRHFTGFWRATWLTAAGASSSIVVAYLGNPYVSATVVAGLAALLAFTIHGRLWGAIGGGIALGWLVVTYPTGALLGLTISMSMVTYRLRSSTPDWSRVVRRAATACAALLLTVGGFLLAGRVLFPDLDWISSVLLASGQDHSVHGSGAWVWLRDISLLVPTATLVVSLANRLQGPHKTPADLAVIISSSSVAFYLVFAPIFGAQFLEAPLHQVLLWAPTLTALGLVAASRMADDVPRTTGRVALIIAALVVVIACGWLAPDLGFALGVVIAVAMTTAVLLAPQRTVSTLLAMAVFFAGAQLLQNSRPPLGKFMLDPYYWAYTSNPNEAKLRNAVNAQQWLIDNTTSKDRLLLWVDGPCTSGDRELYSVAAMQLWGENRVTLEPTLTDDYGTQKMKDAEPTALVLYGRSMDAVWTFWESIPRTYDPMPPECYDFSWPIDPTSAFPTPVGHTCIVRLSKE